MKKQVAAICLQIGCFALCFVFCSLYMLYISSSGIVPQDSLPVNNTPQKMTVIVDAGHGGEDSGAVGIGGVLEKDINLSLCGVLSDLLSVAGAEVIQTRNEDTMLGNGTQGHKKQADLQARVDVGKQNPDAYYVSIHMNKFPKEYCKGIQLFYSSNNRQSLPLAQSLHQMVKEYLQPDNNREIKIGNEHIYLMERLQNPAILVECGFLSNTEEVNLLQDPAYQKKIALLIAASLWETDTDNQAA